MRRCNIQIKTSPSWHRMDSCCGIRCQSKTRDTSMRLKPPESKKEKKKKTSQATPSCCASSSSLSSRPPTGFCDAVSDGESENRTCSKRGFMSLVRCVSTGPTDVGRYSVINSHRRRDVGIGQQGRVRLPWLTPILKARLGYSSE